METKKPACKTLVLDAGPLLSLSPLRGLAEHFVTAPQVLAELKDKNAREHFEKLGLLTGVKVEIREADAGSLAHVIQTAKKTGDYGVLSRADLCVLALTLGLHNKEEAEKPSNVTPEPTLDEVKDSDSKDGSETQLEPAKDDEGESQEPLGVAVENLRELSLDSTESPEDINLGNSSLETPTEPTFDDPSDEDDGEGDWITPDNVDVYKSQALDLFPSSDSRDSFTTVKGSKKGRRDRPQEPSGGGKDDAKKEQIKVGCMTADFAMQNVLLHMDLNLVGLEGKRIDKVKTWVLRCHACFKICKDSSKKFCPSCGNPSLIRTSVTIKSPSATSSSPALEVHLKKNFTYRTRGTIFPIPAPKSGSAKTGTGEGLILREDQTEYVRARRHEEERRKREEKKIVKKSIAGDGGAVSSGGIRVGDWMDPDWMPEMLSVGIGGKGRREPGGRTPLGADGMPIIGYGRKNPNERRRKR